MALSPFYPAVGPPRLLVVQIERHGYRCPSCLAFHRQGDPGALYEAHLCLADPFSPLAYLETQCYHVDEGGAIRLPAWFGHEALKQFS